MDNCMICLNNGKQEIEIDSYISTVLSKYFWFTEDEYFNRFLCSICWAKINDFNEFCHSIKTLHDNFISGGMTIVKTEQIFFDTIETVHIKTEFYDVPIIDEINDTFTCEICGDKFIEKEILRKHMKGHIQNDLVFKENSIKMENDEEKFQCIPKKLNRRIKRSHSNEGKSLLNKHISTKHSNTKSIFCEICKKGFTSEVYLKQHTKFVHLKQSIKKVKTALELKEEDIRIKQFCKLTCEICGSESDTLPMLQKHFKSMHKSSGYVTCCNKRFYKRVRLVEHIDFHENPTKFHCLICNRNYADNEGLQFHMVNIHTPNEMKTFKCDKCDKSFIKAYQLATHLGYHVPKSEHAFACESCDKRFASQEFLNRHIRSHHSQRHICEICAREFKRPTEFKAHMMKHDSNYKPNRYQCPYCPSRLTTSSNLKKHIRQHEDTTEYFCDICGQKAPHKVALQNHKRRVHFTERTHKCNLCSKSFKTKINLKEHTATHTGETLYTCDFCPKTFISNANHASHRKKMHPKEWMDNKLKKKMEVEMGIVHVAETRGRPPTTYQ